MRKKFSVARTSYLKRKPYRLKPVCGYIDNTLHQTFLLCICDCGKAVKINSKNFIWKRATKSCGCIRIKHGHSLKKRKTRTYNCWDNIKRRTDLKFAQARRSTSKTYQKLIEKGIAIDPNWLNFEKFLNDMGECPSNKHSVGRIDNEKGYYKENCRWETQKEQMKNTSHTRFFVINGEKRCLKEWCEIYGANYNTVRSKLRRNIDIIAALSGK